MLEKDVIPAWGSLSVREVTKTHVRSLMNSLLARGCTTTANRTFALIRKMFNWAEEGGLIEISPCHRVRPPANEVPRDRVLSKAEIIKFWNSLESEDVNITRSLALALKLILVTGQRKGEVAALKWDEVDLDKGEWNLPAVKTKKKRRPHVVPLSRQALELLMELKTQSGDSNSPWVFPSRIKSRGAINKMTLDHVINKNRAKMGIENFTPHDLRRTAATGMGELGYSGEIIGKVLNHTTKSVTGIYNRYDMAKEKREALEAWSEHLRSVVKGEAQSS